MVTITRRLVQYLSSQSGPVIVFMGLGLTIFVSFFDFMTADFYVVEFYLIPVALVTWFAGRLAGFGMALINAAAAIAFDILETPVMANPLTHYWNFMLNFVFFLLVVYVLTVLREALEIRSKFTATVSHEIRTPLSVIKEGVSIVLDGLYGALNEKQEKMLRSVKASADRLNLLINDILDFHKFESGKTQIVCGDCSLTSVVREACDGVRLLAEQKSLDLVLNVATDLPKICCDREKIVRVLVNLLVNAIKATDKGSVTVTVESCGKEVRFSVRDTGFGIAPEDMPRLFRSFEQLGSHTRGGSGLGLAIAREIVTSHRGRIWAESKPGEGSTFYFTLPAAQATHSAI